jgi:hypothetical protein
MKNFILIVIMMCVSPNVFAGPCAAIKVCNSGHRVSCTSSEGNCYQTHNGVSCGGGFFRPGRTFTATCPSSYGENRSNEQIFLVLPDGASVPLEEWNIGFEET